MHYWDRNKCPTASKNSIKKERNPKRFNNTHTKILHTTIEELSPSFRTARITGLKS